MPDDETFHEKTFQWFTKVPETDPDRSRSQALGWLDTPNARVAATVNILGRGSVEDVLECARQTVRTSESLPRWSQPEEAEIALRAIIESCASSVRAS